MVCVAHAHEKVYIFFNYALLAQSNLSMFMHKYIVHKEPLKCEIDEIMPRQLSPKFLVCGGFTGEFTRKLVKEG